VFRWSELKMIAIPESVEAIGSEAFFKCKLLELVKFEFESRLRESRDDVFQGCPCGDRIAVLGSLLTKNSQ
jgi:hypothetical protein